MREGEVQGAEAAPRSRERLPLRRVRLPSAARVLPYLRQIDRANWYTNFGAQSRALEARLAGRHGVPPETVLVAANGTTALAAALLALDLPRDGYCIVPSFTFTGTVAAVLLAGLRPWFVDVSRETWALEAADAERALASPPGHVVAAVPVSPFGAPLDQEPWRVFAGRTGVKVVIDAAWCFDSLGALHLPTMVSLHATKVLGVGEGAYVAGGTAAFTSRMRAVTNYGIEADRGSVRIGGNFKMSEYAAAVGHAALDAWPARRNAALRVKRWYLEELGDLPRSAPLPGYAGDWAPATFALRFDDPVAWHVMQRLAQESIESRMWWGIPCHRLQAYGGYPATAQDNTEWLCQRVLCLPFFETMKRGDVRRVARAVRSALG